MKFLVSNYTSLQNHWLVGYRPQIPVLSVLSWICWTPPAPHEKTPGYATDQTCQQYTVLEIMKNGCRPALLIAHVQSFIMDLRVMAGTSDANTRGAENPLSGTRHKGQPKVNAVWITDCSAPPSTDTWTRSSEFRHCLASKFTGINTDRFVNNIVYSQLVIGSG